MIPKRQIMSVMDMGKWKRSKAYTDIVNFIKNLNDSVQRTKLTDEVAISTTVGQVLTMLETLSKWVDEIPPIQQPQRFGNQAFRTWFNKLKENSNNLVKEFVSQPEHIEEASVYLVESFGNDTRIDYGTGHELAFLMFLICLFKCDILKQEDSKACVLKIFENYMVLVRKLQTTYNMEPAGSHGVWSLDDYQFLPFIFGSSQLLDSGINPQSFVEESYIEKHHHEYMFFRCLKYITQVKKGPFGEHSNQLWNISNVPTWSKINSGLIKMYTAEVLDKFPVAQHILFGSFISIDQN